MIAEEVSQFMWWAHEKSKVHKGGNIGGLNIVKGFTYSQILSWMNNVILASRYLVQYSPKIQGNWK
jgi:hypothetical protein